MSSDATATSRRNTALIILIAVVLGIVTTPVVILGLVYLSDRRSQVPGNAGESGSKSTASQEGPVLQQGTVKPEGLGSGQMFYPIPYASPPHLTIRPGDRYLIVRQDEFGFTWLDRARMGDAGALLQSVPELTAVLPNADAPKFDPRQPDLSWEANGMRGSASTQAMKLYEQNGVFVSDFGQQGQVNFPIPYASPPNVELSGSSSKTVITDCTATGFKWRNGSKGEWRSEGGEVNWKARGIRATQVPKGE